MALSLLGLLSMTNENPLVGSWRCPDPFSYVELRVEAAETGFHVTVVDTNDGESADVYDISWDGDALSFAAHWPSTGRLTKYRLLAVDHEAISVSYTYSGQETWVRSHK